MFTELRKFWSFHSSPSAAYSSIVSSSEVEEFGMRYTPEKICEEVTKWWLADYDKQYRHPNEVEICAGLFILQKHSSPEIDNLFTQIRNDKQASNMWIREVVEYIIQKNSPHVNDRFEKLFPKLQRNCIRCDADMGCEHVNHPPDGGVYLMTYGNYGSTVFDPMNGYRLEMYLCDECLKTRADKIYLILGQHAQKWRVGLEDELYGRSPANPS